MADKTDSEERDIYLYQKQILDLDEKLERCQLECYDLEKQSEDLASRCSMLEDDRRNITEYHEYSLLAKEKAVVKLHERLESQQQAIEQDREALKLQHSQEIQGLQKTVDELNSVTKKQAAECEAQKELLMQQVSNMESLKKQIEENEAASYSVIVEKELEKHKLCKELEDLENAIELKTSKIVQKEKALYSGQSKLLSHLLYENDDLKLQKEDLQRQLQDEMDKRAETQQMKKRYQELEIRLRNYRSTHKHMLAEEEELRWHLASVSEKCHQETAKSGQLEDDLQREISKRRELEGIMWEAVTTLRHIAKGSEQASNTLPKKERLEEVLKILKPGLTRAETPDLPENPSFLLARYRLGDLGAVPRPKWKCKPAVSTRSLLLPTSQETSSSVDVSPPTPQSDLPAPAPQSDLSPSAPQ